MEDGLGQVTLRLHESERRYLNLWNLDTDKVNSGGMF